MLPTKERRASPGGGLANLLDVAPSGAFPPNERVAEIDDSFMDRPARQAHQQELAFDCPDLPSWHGDRV
jgi:hypothetical protein